MKRRTLVTVMIGVATLAIVVAALSLAGGGGPDGWPKAMQDNFMDACTGAGATDEQCTCSMVAAEDLYSVEEMRAVEADVSATGQMPEEYVEAINQKC